MAATRLTRFYKKGREIERTGFALVISSRQPLPPVGPDESFIYVGITVRNAMDDALPFAPAEQFWLEDAEVRTFQFPVYALPEEPSEMTSLSEDNLLETPTLPAHAEIQIFCDPSISQDSRTIVLTFYPGPAHSGAELSVAVSRWFERNRRSATLTRVH
jgi:hypothetical protein